VGIERLGERYDHQRNKDKRSKDGERGENAGHGRTILRAATKPAVSGNTTPPSTSAMSCSPAVMTRAAQSLDAACTMATTSSG
jgi:hypothetical protein